MSARPLTPVAELDALLWDLLERVRAVLGDRFVSMYLGGSLATGDFELDRSDVDLVVMTDGALDTVTVDALGAMRAALPALAPKWGLELEVSYMPCEALRHHDPRPAARHHRAQARGRAVVPRHDSRPGPGARSGALVVARYRAGGGRDRRADPARVRGRVGRDVRLTATRARRIPRSTASRRDGADRCPRSRRAHEPRPAGG